MLFVNKQREVERRIELYCEKVTLCLERSGKALETFFTTDDRELLRQQVSEIHQAESQADDIRRDVEVLMYSKTIFPESRGDILGLLESCDKVPNQAESTIRLLYTHHVAVPEVYRTDLLQLMGIAQRCTAALIEAVGKLFEDFTGATVAVGRVDQLESEADYLENQLVNRIFGAELPDLQKVVLRDLVIHLADVCDRAEAAADRIRIIVAKRRI